jgi:hypothetical protein
MSFKKTLIFAIILACIIGFYYYLEVYRAPKVEKEKEEAQKVFHFEQEGAKKLTIVNEEGTFTCQLKGKEWRIVKPIKAECDKDTIDGLIRSLHNLDFSRVVEEEPTNLQQYGLADPLVKITFSAKGKENTVVVGDENPTGSGAYAQCAGEKKVLLIDSYMRSSLNKKLFDLRDKAVITFELDEVKQFSLQKENLIVEGQLKGEDEWVLNQPIEDKADGDKVEEVLNKFRNAKVKEFVDEKPESLKPYGLENPQAKLIVWLGKERALKSLLFGKKVEEGENKGYYAKLQEAGNVFLVEEALVDDIPSDLFDWRDKKLLTFKRDDVKRIALSSGSESVVVKKMKEDTWNMTKPIKTEADRWEISSLLSDIDYVKSMDFIDPPLKDDSYYGFDKPLLMLSLWLKDAEAPISIIVGEEIEEKEEEENKIYVRSTQKKSIALVKGEDIDKLKKTSFDLRNKEILGYQHDNLHEITLKFPEEEVVIGKSRDKWRVQKPRKLKKKEKEAEDLIWTLDSVQMKKIAAESAEDLKPYGLDKPRVEVEVKMKEEEAAKVLLIGKKVKDAEEVYVKLKSQPRVYHIDLSVWKDIEKLIKKEEKEKEKENKNP